MHPQRLITLPTVLAAGLMAGALGVPASAAASSVAVPGERLGARTDARVVALKGAEGGRALRLGSRGRATTHVTLPRAAAAVVVRLRATRCPRAATLRVAVDARVMSVALRSARLASVVHPLSTEPGRHRVAVAVRGARPGCRLELDAVRFRLRAPAHPSAAGASAPPSVAGDTEAPQQPADPSPSADAPPSSDAPSSTGPAGPSRPKLRWARPALTAPTTVKPAQGDVTLSLDATKDYIIDLGTSMHLGGLAIVGGNDVVIVGGAIGIPASSTRNAALTIKNSTGVVHVEGVWFDGSQGHEMDAIQVIAPQATVQVENVRATGLIGSYTTNHTDVIQPWGGVLALRVDRLSADTTYQGIFTRPDQGAIGSVALQHVDLTYVDPGTTTGGYMLWMTTGCDMAPTTLSEVYVQPGPKRTLGSSVWPPTSDKTCPAVVSGTSATWPTLPVTGAVTAGLPADGPFVGPGDAGVGYVSPGYA